MDYTVIATGSKGNCVVINNEIMVDIGIPYVRLEPYLKNIKYIFITHIHSDHLNHSTFKQIRRKWRHIKIYANYDVAREVGKGEISKILSTEIDYQIDDYTLIPFECVHDVPCLGFVFLFGDISVIYATDTSSLEYAPKMKYDYLFLESNHDENIIKQFLGKRSKYGYDVYANAKRHLSTQQCLDFYYKHKKIPHGKLIELHMSERFYR